MKTTQKIAAVLAATVLLSPLAASPAQARVITEPRVATPQMSVCEFLPWWPGCKSYYA